MHFDVVDVVGKNKLNSCILQEELDNYKSAILVPKQYYKKNESLFT